MNLKSIKRNTAFSDNACFWNIPLNGGYYGEIGPGKVGKNNGNHSIDIAVFPNPANNSIAYQIVNNEKSSVSKSPIYRIELIDIMGRRYFYLETESLSGNISTEQLKSGLYYLRVVESYSNIGSNKIIIISK